MTMRMMGVRLRHETKVRKEEEFVKSKKLACGIES